MPVERGKHFTWTLFNYDEHLDNLRSAIENIDYINYICFGFEVCPTTDRLHLQGYLQCTDVKRFDTIRSALRTSEMALVESRGSDEDNRTYCSKDGTFEEFGERRTIKRAGKRNLHETFENICEDCLAGESLKEIVKRYPMEFIKHSSGIIKMHSMFRKKPLKILTGPWRWNIEHDWTTSLHLWGKTMLGKTSYAKALLPEALLVTHIDQLKNYDESEYNGIIFDEAKFLHYPREAQIHVVDVDEERAIHIRYGIAIIPAGTKKIFVSNYQEIFLMDPAISRRITSIHLE